LHWPFAGWVVRASQTGQPRGNHALPRPVRPLSQGVNVGDADIARHACASVRPADPHRLSSRAASLVRDAANVVFVSASAWEIATKQRVSKVEGTRPIVAAHSGPTATPRAAEVPILSPHALMAGSFILAQCDPLIACSRVVVHRLHYLLERAFSMGNGSQRLPAVHGQATSSRAELGSGAIVLPRRALRG